MKKSANQFRQESYNGIAFVSDCRNGAIQWASYGSDTVGYSPLVRGELEATKGGILDTIILFVLAFQFGVKTATNDFLDRIVPIVKSGFRRFQGWYNQDEVNNVLTDVWMVLSGNGQNRKNRAKPFDPSRSSLSYWIGLRIREYTTKKSRSRKLARKLLGLAAIVDDDTPLSSIGDRGLFGLSFEAADDSDQKPSKSKWIKMSAKAGILEKLVETENERAVREILEEIDPVDKEILNLRFLERQPFQAIRDSLENRKLETLTMNGVRLRCQRVLNDLRQKMGVKGVIVGMKGKKGRVEIANTE